MKLILLLGAGVSKLSGLPDVEQLTSSIFCQAYYQDSSVHFSPGRHPDPRMRAADATPRIRLLLRLLKNHDQRDLKRAGTVFRSATTYEDLFYLCRQISDWRHGLADTSLVTPLMDVIESKAGGLLAGKSRLERLRDLSRIAGEACFFLESVVVGELRPTNPVGLNLILELATAPQIDQLNIVTLNHDTLVEQFLTQNGVNFIDGFGQPDGDVRWYDDGIYDTNRAGVRLIKLHGSVNWYEFLRDGRAWPAIFLGTDAGQAMNNQGTKLTPRSRTPSFLSGINKAVSYQRGIYAGMHFRFEQVLRQCQLMVMSGYGWGDAEINLRLDTWLDQRPQNTLLLLHQSPDKLVEKSLILASGYDGWIRLGQLIPIPKWLCEASLSDIDGCLIPDAY